jgi:hypothetical protein
MVEFAFRTPNARAAENSKDLEKKSKPLVDKQNLIDVTSPRSGRRHTSFDVR